MGRSDGRLRGRTAAWLRAGGRPSGPRCCGARGVRPTEADLAGWALADWLRAGCPFAGWLLAGWPFAG
ncbi:hypothetical protein GCM10010519_58560 [Streptomyces lactacystinicus]